MSAIQDAIRQSAEEAGIDPAYALAIAERESGFDPQARASRTIRGLYQMSGPLRQQYGVGDSNDIGEQTKGFGRLLADNKRAMATRLGRDVSDTEAYYGHHFGPGRAARMLTMDPNTSVADVFTANERAQNPHFDRAGTVGSLLSSVGADVDRRVAKHGGGADFSAGAEAAPDLDFSQFAQDADWPPSGTAQESSPDFSQFGTPVA